MGVNVCFHQGNRGGGGETELWGPISAMGSTYTRESVRHRFTLERVRLPPFTFHLLPLLGRAQEKGNIRPHAYECSQQHSSQELKGGNSPDVHRLVSG